MNHGLTLWQAIASLGFLAAFLIALAAWACCWNAGRADAAEDDPHKIPHGDSFPVIDGGEGR